MSKKNILRHEKAKIRKEKQSVFEGKAGSVLKALIVVILIGAIALGGGILYKSVSKQVSTKTGEDIYYTPSHVVESIGYKNKFIVNTIDGIKIVSKNKEETLENVSNAVSPYIKAMKEPVFQTNNKTVLAFDISGKTAVLFNEAGIIQTYNFSGNIIKGKLSNSGSFVFVVEDSGSKAAVKSYSPNGDELLSWYSGKGYVSDAAINNQKSQMAVLTNETVNGEISSKVLLFSLDNDEPFMGKVIGNTYGIEVSYYKDSVLIVCENGVYHLNKDNEIELSYNFNSKKMKHFEFFDNGNLVLFSENLSTQDFTGTVINLKGKTVSEFNVDSFLDISDASDNELLLIKRKGIVRLNKRGRIMEEINCEYEVKDAGFLGDKVVYLSQDKIFFE